MIDLLPCPFCGMKPDFMYGGPVVQVVCSNDDCYLSGSWTMKTEEDAAMLWNKRAMVAEIRDSLEEGEII
jgi:hypothetical protein